MFSGFNFGSSPSASTSSSSFQFPSIQQQQVLPQVQQQQQSSIHPLLVPFPKNTKFSDLPIQFQNSLLEFEQSLHGEIEKALTLEGKIESNSSLKLSPSIIDSVHLSSLLEYHEKENECIQNTVNNVFRSFLFRLWRQTEHISDRVKLLQSPILPEKLSSILPLIRILSLPTDMLCADEILLKSIIEQHIPSLRNTIITAAQSNPVDSSSSQEEASIISALKSQHEWILALSEQLSNKL